VSICDEDMLNDVGVYIESYADVGNHLLIESSGMNPGDINCGAQILLKENPFGDYLAEGYDSECPFDSAADDSPCSASDENGQCDWSDPSEGCLYLAANYCAENWDEFTEEGDYGCAGEWADDSTQEQGDWPCPPICLPDADGTQQLPPWLKIQRIVIDGDNYYLISAPGQTCDTIDLSDFMVGSTCRDAVTRVGTPVQPSSSSSNMRSSGGSCTDPNFQVYEVFIGSSSADTRWLGPNGIMQPSNQITPDPSWGIFTAWDQAEWVGQPSHSSTSAQPQSYFFTHEFALPYHATELDFSWHGMASDQFGLSQSNSKSGGVSIDGYPAAGFSEIIIIDPATWNSAPHHDQEVQWTGGKTWTPINPSQKYILQTIISNDDSQSIQGLIYEIKVQFCMDPQYEHHLPNVTPPVSGTVIDPDLDKSDVAQAAEEGGYVPAVGIAGVMASMFAALFITRRRLSGA
jgi:hypothetical protein